ncbi:MAG: response regulator [Bacteroidia bacterium]
MNYDEVEILFAEDGRDDAILTIRALKKSGLADNLHHVKDGAEAVDFLFCKGKYAERNPANNPRLILLDLKMPKLTGMQVLQKIKEEPKLKSIPVVVLTSSKEDPDVQKCYELGANSYIVKPVDTDKFFNAITDLGLYWMTLSHPPE